jgi:cytochrome c oxidase subunit 2
MTTLTPTPGALPQDPLNLLPPAASGFAADVDGLFYFITYTCIFFFFLITGVLLYSIVRYRRRTPDQPAASNVTHNTLLEVTWTVVPLIIVMLWFALGWKGSLDMTIARKDSLQYDVLGRQWSWTITHPNGRQKTNEMWVPEGTPVRVQLSSADVLHSFFIPAFRVKRDVLPGRYQMVWFETLPGTAGNSYDLFCTEYCGEQHSYMIGKVHVVSQAEWATGNYPEMPTGKALGAELYKQCMACHTLDGNIYVGPSWKGIWGRTEELVDGSTVTVDEAYVIESMREPSKRIVKPPPGREGTWGPPSPMPPFLWDPVKDKDKFDAIIEFMKDQK